MSASRFGGHALTVLLVLVFGGNDAQAQVALNQARALGGGVTPCDTPGFPISICTPVHIVSTAGPTRSFRRR